MSELAQAPVRVLSTTTHVRWVCPVCHRAQSTRVTWPELADVIDGGTMETSCEFCSCPVELSGTEVADLTRQAEEKAREMKEGGAPWVGLTHHMCLEAAWAARKDKRSYEDRVSAGDCL